MSASCEFTFMVDFTTESDDGDSPYKVIQQTRRKCFFAPECITRPAYNHSATFLRLLSLRSVTILFTHGNDNIADQDDIGHECCESARVGRIS